MTSAPPKLRSGLTVSLQPTAHGTFYVVKDTSSEKFFRFGELEQFIAAQLDGETALDTVRQRTETKFGATLPAESLAAFVARLKKAGLLEGGGGSPPVADHRRRLAGSLLYLRYRLLDPNALFDRLLPLVRSCFTPQFVLLSAAAMLVAAGITLGHWGELKQALAGLYRPATIPLVLAVFFVIGSAHEFAHGLTCKRFGGEVHELGILLIYLTPGLYTNVSDAWLFPEKAKRLWVGLAGPYLELFLWALATLAWRVTEADTRINYLALTVMTVSGIKTLFNFNPLIKLDGYYLLSDFLEIPNLRKKSFRYVGTLIKRLFGGGVDDDHVAPIPWRERGVYLAYGLVGAVGSLAVLGYVVMTAGGTLLDHHQPMALLALTGLAGMKSRRRFRKLFGKPAAAADPEDDGEDAAEPDDAPKPPKQAARPTPRRRSIWLALGAIAAAILIFGRMQLRIGGAFTVLPEENADVRAGVDGLLEAILVTEGQRVRAGDVIARLSNHALVAELQKADPAIREVRAQLTKLETGPTPQEVALERAAV